MSSKQMTLAEQMQVFQIIPHELQDVIFDLYALSRKTRAITAQRWYKEFGYTKKVMKKGPEASPFQQDVVGYLIHACRSVLNFPDRLFKNLRVLMLKQSDPLTLEEFEELIKYVYYEDTEKLPLTPKMAKVFRGLLTIDPFARRKAIANRLRMTENSVKWHISEMKRRFYLYRISELDYYKVGLSRLYLLLKRTLDENNEPDPTVINQLPFRYPLRSETFPTGIAQQYVSYQIHTPPWNRRYDFLRECRKQVSLTEAEFLSGEPDLYIATGRRIFYNLRLFDFNTRQWMVNLRDLRFIIKNSLMTGSLGVFPPYDFQYEVDRRKEKQFTIEFDPIDLQICEAFDAIEGETNRFTTTYMVSKRIDIPYKEVASRFERLRKEKVIQFFFWSTLGLSSAFTILLFSKDEFILNNLQSLLAQLPVSSVTRLESLRDKHIRGLHCYTYLPYELGIGRLFQSTFFAEEGVKGFCAQVFPAGQADLKLHTSYDPVRKWWKWDQIAIPQPPQALEYPPNF